MHWLYLAIAVVFEIAVAISAGKAQGFKHRGWTAATLVTGGLGTVLPEPRPPHLRRRRRVRPVDLTRRSRHHPARRTPLRPETHVAQGDRHRPGHRRRRRPPTLERIVIA